MFREESFVREEAADRYSQAELAEKALAEQEENLLELG